MIRLNLVLGFVFVLFSSCDREEGIEPIGLPLVSWDVIEIGPNYFGQYWDYHFLDERQGFFLSNSLLKSEDGGRNFSPITESLNSLNLRELAVLDEDFIWIALDSLDLVNEEVVTNFMHTRDGGENWEKWTVSNVRMDEISFISPEKGFAFGVQFFPDQVDGKYQVFKTDDGGKTWSEVEDIVVNNNLRNFVWKDSQTGYLLDWAGPQYITYDAGETWALLPSIGEPTDILFYAGDENLFFIYRDQQTLRIDRSTGEVQKVVDHPLLIVSHRGEEYLGILLIDGCLNPNTCIRRWVTSSDSGKTWSQKEICPYEVGYNFSSQQLSPGKAVFPVGNLIDELIFVSKK
ncbi:WD40/YVTN/BNR-like repeat-containing protein [Algoriphagus marincola]|uniref:WD40/YVTN/BNR-like repeat-containing protein n=1 Tax=Algoriphagus marincola TaxID=264027 RepID=UPI0003F51F10|nr:hypothetical protein [Algoriphagus marincola]